MNQNLWNTWFEEKVHLNQDWNLVHLSQSEIPRLSLTLNKIPRLSLTFQKNKIFPDFPWCWEPWVKAQ